MYSHRMVFYKELCPFVNIQSKVTVKCGKQELSKVLHPN